MPETCSIGGCNHDAKARGWCRGHYKRWLRHGDPLGGNTWHRGTPEERFWARVTRVGDCWEWEGGKDAHGYGTLAVNRRPSKAHRFSWELHNGPIPPGLNVLHTCDNPGCVRPEHLYVGTQSDNMRDMWSRGRR